MSDHKQHHGAGMVLNDPNFYVVTVSCQRCLERFGRGSTFGRMVLNMVEHDGRYYPSAENDWVWYRQARTHANGGGPRVSMLVFESNKLDFAGRRGVELKCRRCRAVFRGGWGTFVRRAGECLSAEVHEFYV